MKTFILSPILSARASLGALWLVLLLLVCFFFVHLARLARFGWLYQKTPPTEKKQEEPQKEQKKTTPEPSVQEPIYYIVERKKKTRSSYSEPKQIRFK